MSLFPVIEPPPGGLTRLRAAMAERRKTPAWPPLLAGVAALLLVVVALFGSPQGHVDLAGLAERAVYDGGAGTLVLTNGAALRVPSSNPRVVLYRVATFDEPASAPTPSRPSR